MEDIGPGQFHSDITGHDSGWPRVHETWTQLQTEVT